VNEFEFKNKNQFREICASTFVCICVSGYGMNKIQRNQKTKTLVSPHVDKLNNFGNLK